MKNLNELIYKSKQRGWVTYEEINQVIPDEIVDIEYVEQIVEKIIHAGINIVESATDALQLKECDKCEVVKHDRSDVTEEMPEATGIEIVLTRLEVEVLQMRFGTDNDQAYSLDTVADVLDLNASWVLQIERDALNKLRAPKYTSS